jgi:26S proteasome regulatory subunit T5
MSTLEDLDDLEREEKEDKKEEKKKDADGKDGKADGDAEMKDAEPEEILNSSTRDIIARKRLLENDMRIMKSEFQRLTHEKANMNEKIKDNLEKIENNRYAYADGSLALNRHMVAT